MPDGRLAIAVIGPGRAGRARARALEEHPRARLAAVVGARPAAGEPAFEDVLRDPSVDALVVCTPNHLHAPMARQGLQAGKHVAVEFPLAPGPDEARALFALARAERLVLHDEHIELLSPAQQWLRERREALGVLREGRLVFRARGEGWIADAQRAGSEALRAVARLHRLVDLFGEARVIDARVERGSAGAYRLEARLAFAAGGTATLVEERAPDAQRGTHWDVRCERGVLGSPPEMPAAGLFARDLDVFVDRVVGGAPHYVDEARIVHVLALVQAIERACEPAG